jgi:integrase
MRLELSRWYAILINGSSTPPRSKPRSEQTTRLYLRWSLPALRVWAASGKTSLREITPEDVRDVLPGSGNRRATMGQGLRCLFRVLTSHRVIFLNPIGSIRTGTHETRQPLPLPSAVLRDALNSPDSAGAALAAIVAFHGVRSGQLRKLQLTDIHDGRLHLDNRTIPLAQSVRDRLSAWLAYREERWPVTRNPHMLVSRRTALDTAPVGVWWITKSMGMTAQEAREDRILHELHASGGDIRRLCDMFGLSIAGASRYLAVLSHRDLEDA